MPVVFTAKSYSCGPLGRVRRLLDLLPGIPAGTNWTNVNVPEAVALGITLWDIETSPVDGNHVFAVGDCGNGLGPIPPFYGVAVSTNGGANWLIPTGNYSNAPIANLGEAQPFQWSEIVVVGPQVYGFTGDSYLIGSAIIATHGLAAIAKSIDGGASYNLIGLTPGVGDWNLLLPVPQQGNLGIINNDGRSIHFDGQVGVIGLSDYVVKSSNGGNNWLILNDGAALTDSVGNPLNTGPLTGITIKANQTMITAVCLTKVVTTCQQASPMAGEAVNTWIDSSFFLPPTGFIAPIGWHISPVFFPYDDLLYVTGDFDLNLIAGGGGGCGGWVNPGTYYSGGGASRRAAHVFTFLPQNALVGTTAALYNQNNQVWFTNNIGLLSIQLFDQPSEGLDYIPTAVWTQYEEHQEPEPQCYILESCSNPGTYISTDQNLAPIGQVVTLNQVQYPGCWTVVGIAACNGSEVFLSVNLSFATCDLCQGPPCYYLQDCDNPATQYFTTSNLNPGFNFLFYFTQNLIVTVPQYPGVCFRVFQSQNCTGPYPQLGPVLTSSANCQSCPAQCYRLVDCLVQVADIITDTDLSLQVGNVVKIVNSDICWQVFDNFDVCTGAVSVTVIQNVINCTACLPVCYLLTNCVEPFNTLVISNVIPSLVGQVIKIGGYTECWQVSIASTCTGSIFVSVTNVYGTCIECLPPPPPPIPTPVDLNPRRVKPGYYTPGCNPAYTEKVNCNFADQIYMQMLVPRYGISICCEEDVNKWDIKKQLLEFAAIYDPSLCKCTIQVCCPPTCVHAIIQQFNPQPACVAPTNATAEIVQPPPLCTAICWLITPGLSGPCDISYVDCLGVPQVQNVQLPIYICSIILPIPACPDLLVQSTAFNCSSGLCVVPPPCNCYEIAIPFDGEPHTINYTICGGANTDEIFNAGGVFRRCSEIVPTCVDVDCTGVVITPSILNCGLGECIDPPPPIPCFCYFFQVSGGPLPQTQAIIDCGGNPSIITAPIGFIGGHACVQSFALPLNPFMIFTPVAGNCPVSCP
jgi:hypothetical protein